MHPTPKDLYLDLLKKALSYSIWPEPLQPLAAHDESEGRVRELIGEAATLLHCEPRDVVIGKDKRFSADQREDGMVWPEYAHTMVGLKRLNNLERAVETILEENIPGDFIETGVWRGGVCIFLKALLAINGVTDRKVIVADSFAGLPEPDPEKYPDDDGDPHHTVPNLAVSLEQVRKNFESYDLLDDRVVFLKGWFEDTLPGLETERFALIRLDGDMYGSTMVALESLYPKLSPGGFCVIDDYALPNCKKAVTDFRERTSIEDPIEEIDWTGVFWRKS